MYQSMTTQVLQIFIINILQMTREIRKDNTEEAGSEASCSWDDIALAHENAQKKKRYASCEALINWTRGRKKKIEIYNHQIFEKRKSLSLSLKIFGMSFHNAHENNRTNELKTSRISNNKLILIPKDKRTEKKKILHC